jgi:5'(3')-deoxyribonucleotidase
MPKLTIAVDVDDVLFPFVPEIMAHYNGLRGAAFRLEDFSKYHFSEVWGISEEDANGVIASYLAKDVVHLSPVPGAQEALARLAEDFRLIVVTARNGVYEQPTRKWLDMHFGNLIEDAIFAGNPYDCEVYREKGEVCVDLGAALLIDDSPNNLQSALEHEVDALLFGAHQWNQVHSLPATVPRCATWPEVVDYIRARYVLAGAR